MSASEERTTNEMRTRAFEILEHAKQDAEYLQKLRDDPDATLEAAGFAGSEAGHLVGELGLGEVAGYIAEPIEGDCEFTCNTGTCWITRCNYIPVTNY